jgi:hypothetical protein
MILHCPANDPAAVEIDDGGQPEPAFVGLDLADVGEPDLVWRSSDEVPIEKVRGDRNVVATIGGAHPA